MTYVFAHELLMKDLDNEEFGLTDKEYIGISTLYKYRRFGFHFIYRTGESGDCVVGDIWDVNDGQLKLINNYFNMFGYRSVKEPVYRVDDSLMFECLVFLKEDEIMIDKKELELLGSSEPFTWLKESFDILDKEFRDLWESKSDIAHFRTNSVEGFKKEIEQYVKDHPDDKIYASGFVLSTENPEKNKAYKYRKD